MKDYESLCSNVMMEAVSREKNAEYLQNVPHFDMADLSIIYRVNVGGNRNHGIGVITVDNRLLNSMGVSQDQFQKDVLDRALTGEPPILRSLTEVIGGGFISDGSGPDGALFLATNSEALYGASVIAIPGFLDQAAEKLGGNFYILPSSVHEVLPGGERYEDPADVSVEADRNVEALMKGDTALMESYLQEMIDKDQSPEMTTGAKKISLPALMILRTGLIRSRFRNRLRKEYLAFPSMLLNTVNTQSLESSMKVLRCRRL